VGGRVGVVTASEITVVGGDDGVLGALLDVGPVPLTCEEVLVLRVCFADFKCKLRLLIDLKSWLQGSQRIIFSARSAAFSSDVKAAFVLCMAVFR